MNRSALVDQRRHISRDIVNFWKTLLDDLIRVLGPDVSHTEAAMGATVAPLGQMDRSRGNDNARQLRFRHVAETRRSVCWIVDELPGTQVDLSFKFACLVRYTISIERM